MQKTGSVVIAGPPPLSLALLRILARRTQKNGAEFFLRPVCDVILTTYASCTVDSLPFLACHALMYSQASSALSAR